MKFPQKHTNTHSLQVLIRHQYSKTNKMHFWYSAYHELTASTCFEHYLLIFRRCYTNNTWYIACVLSVGFTSGDCNSYPGKANTHKISSVVCATPSEDVQLVLETCRGHNKWNTKSVSHWFYCTDILQCTVNRTLSLLTLQAC
jgi:hypothetical protein